MSVRAFRSLLRQYFRPSKVNPIRRSPRLPSVEWLEDRVNPAPIQFFYIPMPETQVNAAFDAIVTTKTISTTQESITTITVTESNTTIWYDQWEDGYEAKLGNPLQSTTQIWGDGNDANGIAPGFSKDPLGISSGTVLQLRNTVNTPRDLKAQPTLFDSPDRFGADRSLAVSRAQFPTKVDTGGGSVIASAVEVRDTRYFDTNFTAPVGVDTGNAGSMFSHAAFYVQAYLDNTRIQIDANNDGDFIDVDDRDVVVNQGATVVSGATVKQGARVVADRPVQTDLLTGQVAGQYASRTYALFSDNQLANDYFTPVGFDSTIDGTNDDVRIYVFNPSGKAFDVTQESKAGIGNITKSIPAGGTNYFDITANTGTRLFSPNKEEFAAAGTHDQQGTTHDWGFSLQPVPALSQIAIVGLGVGNSSNPPSGDTNTSPIFVTALADTKLFVDHNNDGTVDQTVSMKRLESVRLRDTTDNDSDNSGMRVYTNDGTLISVVWGEDGSAPTGSPGFDAGTTVPAVPVPEYYKFSEFAPGGDLNGDGLFNEGEIIRYSLRIRHIGTTPITNAVITDILPVSQVTYIPNTTVISVPLPNTPIPDDGSGTAYPLDGTGFTITNINPGQTIVVSFDAKIKTGLPAGYNNILNQSVLRYDIFEIPANDVIDLRGTVGDRVWYDVNGDGKQDAGEPGIVGATVSLNWLGLDGVAGGGDDKTFTFVTVADGKWSLTNLPAGNYTTSVSTLPFGLTNQTFGPATFNLVSGQVIRDDIDFGFRGTGSLDGLVFRDDDNSGSQNGAEPGIPGATITITGTDAAGVVINRTEVTDASGKYSFQGLLAGTYTVTETQPASFLDGKDAKGTSGGTVANDSFSNIALADGAAATGYTFGELVPASLSGAVYHDKNANGAFNVSDIGIGGAKVTLTGTDDLGAPVNIPLTTSPDGSYTFTDLRPGNYAITETQPSPYLDGGDTLGSAGGTPSNDKFSAITVNSGTAGKGYNFGEIGPSITGTLFIDVNRDGTIQGGDIGKAGVTISLSNGATATTDASGNFTFINVIPGSYTVSVVTPPGFGTSTPTSKVADIMTGDSSGNNFGITLSTLSGIVFRDDDNNGSKNGAEPGLTGVTVTLVDSAGKAVVDGYGNAIAPQVTVAGGAYQFTGILSGDYKVIETQPAGFLQGTNSVGKFNSITTGTVAGDTISVSIPTGQDGTAYNFAEIQAATISGFVYRDNNNDGLLAGGEPGISGVSLTLSGTDDLGNAVNVPATTDGTGFFSFTSLRPSDAKGYSITQSQPAGFLDGLDTRGNLTAIAGSAKTDLIGTIIVAPGQTASGNNFGELLPSSLAGTVFLDSDNNGSQNGGEAGLAGVTITLTGTDDLGTPINVNQTTDSLGKFVFTLLRPGTYTITETQPAGFLDGKDTLGSAGGTPGNDTASNITLSEGADGTGYTFGELPGTSLAGFVYHDKNNDNIFDVSEPGIAGVTITLTGVDDLGATVNLKTTTAAGGGYSFPDLRPGTYTITETQPGNYNDGQDKAGSVGGNAGNDAIDTIVLASGNAGLNYNFGERGTSLSGSVFYDADFSSTFNAGDIGKSGVTVSLSDGVTTINLPSDGSGKFSFDELPAGTYTVSITVPTGFGTSTVTSKNVVLPLAGSTGNDFGLTLATLAGTVFRDDDNSGNQNGAEPGLAGVTISITDNAGNPVTDGFGNVVNPTSTIPGGGFQFTGLLAGTYKISETQPGGFLDGKDAKGTAGGTLANDTVSGVTMIAGSKATGYTFGELLPATISGVVFQDNTNDGVQNFGEPGLDGVTVTLSGTDDLGNAVNIPQTTVGGIFSFGNLRPGTYQLVETQPAGFLDGKDANGSAGGIISNDTVIAITIVSGMNGAGYSFGELQPATLGGFVYADANGNGTFDVGDAPISGETVTLTGTDDLGNAVNLPATSQADGSYTFTNLRPSDASGYRITETQPAAYNQGTNAVGTITNVQAGQTTTIGTAGPGVDQISGIVLASGTLGKNYNFGEVGSGLSGTVFIDDNRDGSIQAGDLGLANVTVTISDGVNSVNVPTDANGNFNVSNLLPGNYTVTVTVPTGFGTSTSITKNVVLTASGSTGNNFGLTLSTLAGTVFRDDDNSGIQNGAEPGLAGVSVTMTDVAGNPVLDGYGKPIMAQTTDASGAYSFKGLLGGDYKITETQPAGLQQGKNTVGVFGGIPTGIVSGDTFSVTIPQGKDGTGYNFAERGTGAIGDRVWFDADNDGMQDPGEPGINGVTVTLIEAGPNGTFGDGDDVSFGSTTTSGDGTYAFINLSTGNYTVTITAGLPAGLSTSTFDLDGTGTANTTVLALTAGNPTRMDADFGYRGTGVIGDLVWNDQNGDGIQNNGEPGLPNLPITVNWSGPNGNVIFNTTTDANGGYSIGNLPAGSFSIAVNGLPANFTITTPAPGAFTLAPAEIRDTLDYGYIGDSSIGDLVWYDVDASGTRNNAEPGLGGVNLNIVWFGADNTLGTPDDVTYSDTTASDGMWGVSGLPQGQYVATVNAGTLPAGFTARTADLDGVATADSANFILNAAQNRNDVDYGYRGTGAISGLVTEDMNGDGIREGLDPAIGGVVVSLLDGAGNILASSTTASGSYSFPGLAPGSYSVVFTAPGGYTFTPGNTGSDDSKDSDADAVTGQTPTVTLPVGGTTVFDAGLYRTVTIGDRVFSDTNGNGLQDGSEAGLNGVTVTLFHSSGAIIATTTTAGGGLYAFNNVAPGSYSVGFSKLGGFIFTAADQGGNDATDSDADATTGKTATFAVNSGKSDNTIDAGQFQTAGLSGVVWLDQDSDGKQDPSEPGLGGVTVTGIYAGPDGKFGTGDDLTLTPTITGPGGNYAFTGVPPGQYKINVDTTTLPAGVTVPTFDNDGVGTPNATIITLPSSGTLTNVDFGNTGTGVIGDLVWYNPNSNSTQDAGEPGFNGVTVNLTWAGPDGDFNTTTDNLTLSTTTTNGSYAFGSLPAGPFRITVDGPTIPAGFAANFDLDGANTPNTALLILANGQTRMDADFGFGGTATIKGTVFVDDNGDTDNTGDPGLPNVTVTITGTDVLGNSVNVTVVTGPDGSFSVPGLAPGQYTVNETQPTGYGSSTTNTIPVTLAPGSTATTLFGDTLATLTGTVYTDVNVNGQFDPGTDTGLPGATITLTGTDATGANVTRTTTTAGDGSYAFTGLLAGSYTLTETQPTGVYDGLDAPGTLGGTLGTPLGDNTINAINVGVGSKGSGYLFGEFPPAGAFGFVYQDKNANGIRDNDEPGIPGVTITISGTSYTGTLAAAAITPASVVTDADGRYEFNPLPPGTYSFKQTQPAGYIDGMEQATDPAGVSISNDSFSNVVLNGLPSRGAFNFGEFLPASLSGTVILDVNQDGIADPTSIPLGGILVTITGADILGNPVALTTSTAPNGTYTFNGLVPGTYSVTFTPPQYLTVIGAGTIPGVVLTSNTQVSNLDFAVAPNPRTIPLTSIVPNDLPPVVIRILSPEEISKREFLSTTPSAEPEDLSGLPQNPQFANTAKTNRSDGRTTPLYVAASADSGLQPEVRVFDYSTGRQVSRFFAYDPAFNGGVRVTVADIDGDGIDEIVTAPGRGGGPLVRVFRADGTLISQMLPYDVNFRGGLWIAAGDLDGDHKAEIVTGTDVGGGPHVKIMNGQTGGDLGSWFAYDPNFRGGVRVAIGDLDGNGKGEIITAAGIGGGPHIQVFDPVTRASMRSFFAFDSALRGGTFITTGDTNGDGIDEIVVGAGNGGAPQVRVFNGTTFNVDASFFAGNITARNGIRVATADINADGRDDIVTGAGAGGASEVRIYDSRVPTLMEDFFAFNPTLRGGVFVG